MRKNRGTGDADRQTKATLRKWKKRKERRRAKMDPEAMPQYDRYRGYIG